jgi:biopolymer transport protein ExbB
VILLSILEYSVLLLLFGLSIWSVSIMIDRKRAFEKEVKEDQLDEVRQALIKGERDAAIRWSLAHSGIHAGVIQAAMRSAADGKSEAVEPSVRAFLLTERPRYEKGFAILATLGANAPFIGLFGTVLGIIRAFAALGDNSGAGASVMSGISLALIATAAGLFVAIPAVVGFNAFSNRWKSILAECDSLKELIIAQALMKSGR